MCMALRRRNIHITTNSYLQFPLCRKHIILGSFMDADIQPIIQVLEEFCASLSVIARKCPEGPCHKTIDGGASGPATRSNAKYAACSEGGGYFGCRSCLGLEISAKLTVSTVICFLPKTSTYHDNGRSFMSSLCMPLEAYECCP